MIKSNTPPPEAITRSYIAAFVRVLVLAAFLVTAVQSSALAFSTTLVNQTGRTITGLYVQIGNDLSRDLLGSSVLGNGSSWTISGPGSSGNVTVIAAMGAQHRRWTVNVGYSRVVLR